MLERDLEARGRLVAIVRSPGWKDLIDIGNELCNKAQTELLKMDRANGATSAQIASKQDQVRAMFKFKEELFLEASMQSDFVLAEEENERIEREREREAADGDR